ncbi:hypothetical protein RQCS_11940 [Rhodococcus qingshengii]|uniref:hypothetical protein n=1 Tax=Rhodococcus qingshengii TaxID=334542 RepID=UPI0007E5A87D|nr:hypothetical protein [Rhodococcus qingshengii]BCF81649.1 hypothetical protein RQCS_11940 [Rhodococcus qingshengii]
MTIPNPLPEHLTILDDNGIPDAIVNVDVIQMTATRLMYDMAANSGDTAALDQISVRYLDEVGVDLFGYVASAALRLMTTCVLEPTLAIVDEALPTIALRTKLEDSARNAHTTLT